MSVAKIYSILGNPKSLIPLGIKDVSGTAGITAASFATGKEEGQDRFIDEAGTEVIWLLGIPAAKKFIDLTAFKTAKLDPEFDVRNLHDKEILEKTKKYAPTEEIKNNIEKISKNQKLYKGLSIGKFAAAVTATIGAYFALTNAKQKYTETNIAKNLLEEQKLALDYGHNLAQEKAKTLGSSNKNKNENVSFKSGFENFMLNPVANMYILEGSITGSRLAKSRNKQELVGYAIKEGGFLAFMYVIGQQIQNAFEKIADKKHNKSIALDARVIEDTTLADAFKTKEIEKSLAAFPKEASDAEIYEFLHNNPENEIVKRAKQSDIIKLYKKTDKIDTRKYIDIKKVKGVKDNLSKLYEQYQNSGETTEVFFSKLKKLKRGSVIANIGTSILALGVVIPGIMLGKRLANGDTEFEVKNEVKQKLIEEGKLISDKKPEQKTFNA